MPISAETVITQLKAIQTAIEEQYWCKILSSTILNNNFDRKVFLQLLDHIIKIISTNYHYETETPKVST